MNITSLNNDRVKYYAKLLNSKKEREKEKFFVVEGDHLVEEAIKENVVKELLISDMNYDHYLNVDKIYVTQEIMKKICDTVTPQGIIALCSQKKMSDLTTLNRLLLLDDIQDPGNLGTIIRTADAFNFDGIVMSENTVDLYNPKVIRSTQGAIFRVKIIKTDLLQYVNKLISKGVLVYGTSLNGVNLSEILPRENMAFIMGNEGNGVSKELLDLVNDNVFIEMNGNSESLNVAIASSIIMYNFRK